MRSLLLATVLILFNQACTKSPSAPQSSPCEAHFSPRGGCTDAVVAAIDSAKISILIQTAQVPAERIGEALLRALSRGVKVEAILDKSPRVAGYSVADFFSTSGVNTFIDSTHESANNKTMVLDDQILVTGSFDFSKAAEEHRADNLLIVRDPNIAKQYVSNWNAHLEHSEKYGKP
jgi:phosphatidylserine/phosphatidylglycerophosphate/cardiolipin synthase-like enzyme